MEKKLQSWSGAASMANQPRSRKKVHVTIPRRPPDGSAFQKCDNCD